MFRLRVHFLILYSQDFSGFTLPSVRKQKVKQVAQRETTRARKPESDGTSRMLLNFSILSLFLISAPRRCLHNSRGRVDVSPEWLSNHEDVINSIKSDPYLGSDSCLIKIPGSPQMGKYRQNWNPTQNKHTNLKKSTKNADWKADGGAKVFRNTDSFPDLLRAARAPYDVSFWTGSGLLIFTKDQCSLADFYSERALKSKPVSSSPKFG